MKKKIGGSIVISALALIAIFNISINSKDNKLINFSLDNVEALADDEYIIGSWGTNWKTYQVECLISSTSAYTVNYPGYGITVAGTGVSSTSPGSYTYSTTSTYKAVKSCCGSGGGTCLSPAGC